MLPSENLLNELQAIVEKDAFRKIQEAYASTTTSEELLAVRPSVMLVRLDEHHLVIRIEFAAPEKSVGDAALISQWGVMLDIDRVLHLEELQGLPCELWFPLRAGREAR